MIGRMPRLVIPVRFFGSVGSQLILNRLCGITGPSIICRDNELPVPPHANPLGITSSTIPPNSGELPSRQQQRSPEEGYSCLSCGAHEVLKAIAKRLIRRAR